MNMHVYNNLFLSLFLLPYFTPDLCDFENGDCDYTQDPTDDFDWKLQQGGTPTQGTGPATDHTYYTAYGRMSAFFNYVI